MTLQVSSKEKQVNIKDSEALANILVKILKREKKIDKDKEHFWGIYLDSRNKIKRIELISLGILNANLVHPRETFKPAIESSAASVIIAHNHPSNEIDPSENDITMTNRLKKAGKLLGIELMDHLIIDEEGKHYSFRNKNLL